MANRFWEIVWCRHMFATLSKKALVLFWQMSLLLQGNHSVASTFKLTLPLFSLVYNS